MKLFELFATLSLDKSGFDKGVKSARDDGKSLARSLGNGIGNTVKAVGVGLAAAGAAFTAVTKTALDAVGDLEQAMGGAVAVFGDDLGNKLINSASDAASAMGMSADEFLANANKIGSLLQGMGFSQEEAMGMSEEMMQRAADVASIMGISVNDAINAVVGMSKGNFTMMDNLGVAMNDTTLQAYALEKGLLKQGETMSQNAKIAVAYAMFMDKSSYAAGNYAKENETLAGSMTTLKAEWQNFLSGAGDVDNFVTALEGVVNVVGDSLLEIIPRLSQGLSQIATAITAKLPAFAKKMLPGIIQGAYSVMDGLITALPAIMQGVVDVLPDLLAGAGQLLPALVNNVLQCFMMLFSTLASSAPTLVPQLVQAIVQTFTTCLQNAPGFFDAAGNMIYNFVTAAVNAVTDQVINPIITKINEVFGTNIPTIDQINFPTWEDLKEYVTTWWNDTIKPSLQAACDWVLNAFENPVESGEQVRTKITEWWNGVVESVQNACTWVLNLFTNPDENQEAIITKVTEWWNGVKDAVEAACVWALQFFGFAGGETEAKDLIESVATWWDTWVVHGLENLTNLVIDWTLGAVDPALQQIIDWWDDFMDWLGVTKSEERQATETAVVEKYGENGISPLTQKQVQEWYYSTIQNKGQIGYGSDGRFIYDTNEYLADLGRQKIGDDFTAEARAIAEDIIANGFVLSEEQGYIVNGTVNESTETEPSGISGANTEGLETAIGVLSASADSLKNSANNLGDTSPMSDAVSGAVRAGLSGLSITMNGQAVGNIVFGTVSDRLAELITAGRYA